MSQLEKLIAQNRLDLDLMIANDKVSRAARPRQNTDLANRLSKVDAELVRQYNLQFKKAQAIPKIDTETGEPILDEFGKPVMVYRKYQMPPHPNVPPIDDKLGVELSSADIRRLNKQHDETSKRIEAIQAKLADLIQKRTSYAAGTPNKGRIIEYDTQIESANTLSKELEGNLRNIESLIGNNDEVVAANDSIRDQYERDQEIAMEMFNKGIEALNQNGFNTERNEGETDADYYQRMQDNAEVSAADEELEDAKIFAKNTFRNHLMELFNDNVKIESIYHHYPDLEKLKIIKQWPGIYKYFTRQYGTYRFAVGPQEFYNFIEDYFRAELNDKGGEKQQEAVPFTEEYPASPASLASLATPARTSASFVGGAKQASSAQPMSESAIKAQRISELKDQLPLDEIPNFKRESLNQLYEIIHRNDLTEDFKKPYNSLQRAISSSKNVDKIYDNQYKFEQLMKEVPAKRSDPFTSPSKSPRKATTPTTKGKGIDQEEIDQWARFGKLIINYDKLYHKNIFSVKYPTKGLQAIVGLPNTKVSDHFVKIIIQLLDGSNPTVREINGLHDRERHIYDRVLYIAGLNKKVGDNKHDKTVADMKKRMQLIEGEVEAGNNSPLLAKDLYQTLHTLKDLNVITQKEINRYLSQFKK